MNSEKNNKWDQRFLELAKEVSTWSKDPSTQVGAVVVKDRVVVGTGYNGFAKGVLDLPERYNDRPMKYKLVVHAEVNACISAGKEARGGILYVYPAFLIPPICHECAKVAIQSGIVEVVGWTPNISPELAQRWEESINLSRTMFNECGIHYRSVEPLAQSTT